MGPVFKRVSIYFLKLKPNFFLYKKFCSFSRFQGQVCYNLVIKISKPEMAVPEILPGQRASKRKKVLRFDLMIFFAYYKYVWKLMTTLPCNIKYVFTRPLVKRSHLVVKFHFFS